MVKEPDDSTSIDVTFVIEAGDAVSGFAVNPGTAFREELSVTLNSDTPTKFTVLDIFQKIDDDSSNGLDFDIITTTNPPGEYLKAVTYGGTTWDQGQMGLDGWVFRINDKFPVQKTSDRLGYEGTGIDQTYLNDGDVVHFLYDFPSIITGSIGDVAANYVRGVYDSSTVSSLTVQLQGHKTFIDQHDDFPFYVYNYTDFGDGIEAELYEEDGTFVGSATSSSNGQVTFTGDFDSNETYILKTESELREVTGTWGMFIDDAYFINTGAYSKVTIP